MSVLKGSPRRPAAPRTAKARDLASWILTAPDNLDDEKKEKLARPRSTAAPRRAPRARHRVHQGPHQLHGDRLDDDQPDPHSYAYGIKRDQQAVLNRLVDLFTVHV